VSVKEWLIQRNGVRGLLIDNALYMIIAALIFIIAAFDISFFSIASFNAILTQSSTRLIFACGVGGIIVLGGTDLALGRCVGIAGVIAASMLQSASYSMRAFHFSPLPLFIPILIAMAVAMAFSLMQGFVVSKLGVPSFIASLGFQLLVFGCCSLYFNVVCGANPISNFTPSFVRFSQGTIRITRALSISYIMLYAIVICFLIGFIWNKTILGKNMFAIGGNREAAKVSGVDVHRTMMIVYMIAGLLYGFGGALEAGRTGSAISAMGQSYELDAIAACVVGGASMRGGTGTVTGIALGVVIFQIISYGLIYIGISPDLQYVVKGLIILIAVAIDTRKHIRR